MYTVLKKNQLRNGYYYSGYVHQHACCVVDNEPKIVGLWDSNDNCFWFWEFENNTKIKSKMDYLLDIDNEIEYGFYPLKEVIPKEEHIVE